ncbi:MAG TPA: EAL domain-containing protein [Methylophilaceae bacterium]|nr:EAL domain-containing protein [Methylophilaceae bacterium]
MKPLGIKSRVLFLAIIPAMIIAVLLTSYSIANSSRALDGALHDRGRIIASQLAPSAEYGVVSGNYTNLQPLVQQVITYESDIVSVLITDSTGRTLAVSGHPITIDFKENANSSKLREWHMRDTIVFSAPILRSLVEVNDYAAVQPADATQNRRVEGHVYVALTTQHLASLKNSLILHNLLIALVGLIASGLLAWRIGRGITMPIQSLAMAVRSLGAGQLNVRIPETATGLLQTLQQGFNAMATQLKQAHDEMQQRIDEATHLLTHQANHDELTGLVNRREFERRLTRVLRSAQQHGTQHVFCYMDLDQFKIVNDTCGHSAGDGLLRQLSILLNSRIRDRDTLARLGGDEFGLLLENCSVEDANIITEELREMVQDFRYIYQEKIFNIGVSIGMVAITGEMDNVGNIMSAADTACYTAKDNGRNRIHLFRALDDDVTKRHSEMEWIARLTRAMEEDRFLLYVQPILPIAGSRDRYRYFEILLRKVDIEGRIYLPMAFIPAAERYLLMNGIDRWVIRNAFANYRQLLDNNPANKNCVFTINLSGVSLGDKTLLGYIREQFAIYAVPPQAICFEVTETSAIVNLANTIELMEALKKIGCRFLLDDFGSGMSSFAYLKNLPVDFLKMDGAYVRDIATNPIDRAMVQSVHSIAQAMQIKTIAEFVESDAVMGILKAMGVHYGQGHYLAEPMPIERLLNLPAKLKPLA